MYAPLLNPSNNSLAIVIYSMSMAANTTNTQPSNATAKRQRDEKNDKDEQRRPAKVLRTSATHQLFDGMLRHVASTCSSTNSLADILNECRGFYYFNTTDANQDGGEKALPELPDPKELGLDSDDDDEDDDDNDKSDDDSDEDGDDDGDDDGDGDSNDEGNEDGDLDKAAR